MAPQNWGVYWGVNTPKEHFCPPLVELLRLQTVQKLDRGPVRKRQFLPYFGSVLFLSAVYSERSSETTGGGYNVLGLHTMPWVLLKPYQLALLDKLNWAGEKKKTLTLSQPKFASKCSARKAEKVFLTTRMRAKYLPAKPTCTSSA